MKIGVTLAGVSRWEGERAGQKDSRKEKERRRAGEREEFPFPYPLTSCCQQLLSSLRQQEMVLW